MTTLYFAETVNEDGDKTQVACATQQIAKDAAKVGYEKFQEPMRVLKVELNKDVGSRELMCALFNQETNIFMGSKELIYTAGPRTRKGKAEDAEPEPEANPYDI